LVIIAAGAPAWARSPCPPVYRPCDLQVDGRDGCSKAAEWILEGTVTGLIEDTQRGGVVLAEKSLATTKGVLDTTKPAAGIGWYGRAEIQITPAGGGCVAPPQLKPSPSWIGKRLRFFGAKGGYFAVEVID
jgi:hypothetical protein